MEIPFAGREHDEIRILAAFGPLKTQPVKRRSIAVAADQQAFAAHTVCALPAFLLQDTPGDLAGGQEPVPARAIETKGCKPPVILRRTLAGIGQDDDGLSGLFQPDQRIYRPRIRPFAIPQHAELIDQKRVETLGDLIKAGDFQWPAAHITPADFAPVSASRAVPAAASSEATGRNGTGILRLRI